MSTQVRLEELQLKDTARAAILRLARRIAEGFEGEVQVIVMRDGGIRSIKWIQLETGESIREELG